MRINQWRKDVVSWHHGPKLYLSVPFTWSLPKAEQLANAHKGPVVAGGPAVQLMGAPWTNETPEHCDFDVLAMHNPYATFTTRGCPKRCSFCAVPRIEGEFHELDSWKPAPMICDNNLLAASRKHFQHVIDSTLQFPLVDFNQGLDARLFTIWHARQMARLRRCKVRFSFDHVNMEPAVAGAIQIARAAGLKDITIYVLIGYGDTPEEARYRLERVIEWKCMPAPMRYQPLDALKKNSYVAPAWTDRELRRMVRYFWKYRFLKKTPYEDYRPESLPLFAFEEEKR